MHKAGAEDYVVRSQNYYRMIRSVNVELDLDAGEYVVVVKVDAHRSEHIMPVEEVVRAYAKDRREKLLRIGQAYDLAHAKGKIIETAEEKEAREAYQERRRNRERKSMAKFLREQKADERRRAIKQKIRERRRKQKDEARAKARAERKAAGREARAKAREEEEEQASRQESEGESEGNATANKTTTVTSDEQAGNAEDGGSQTEEGLAESSEGHTEAKTLTEEKHDNMETPPDAEQNGEGSTASTEPGEGAHTPTSSTVSSKQPKEAGEERSEETSQEDEAYITAAEEIREGDLRPVLGEEPSTPKPAKSTTPPSIKSVDIGVQTGPGLPPSPPFPHGPPPPPNYLQGMLGHPPPPTPLLPPGAEFSRGPSRDLSHIPPHLRAAYVAHLQEEQQRHQRQGPPVSETEVVSDSSESEVDENISDVSDVSEDEIEAFAAAHRAQVAARAAAAVAAKAQPSPPAGCPAPVPEEPLDEFEKDPWNAVGVFGLRVYYKTPEGPGESETDKDVEGVTLRVERPNYYVWDESSDDEDDDEDADDERDEDEESKKEMKDESQVLDVDDSAKDAAGETPPSPGVELLNELKGKDGEKEQEEEGSKEKADANNEDETKEADVFEDAESSHESGK